jgi:hypothetical protein
VDPDQGAHPDAIDERGQAQVHDALTASLAKRKDGLLLENRASQGIELSLNPCDHGLFFVFNGDYC